MLRKIILLLTPLLILTILFLLIVLIINRDVGKGALQVTSIPNSQVFVDGKFVGKTPLCLCELPQLLKVKDYTLKLVPTESGFNTLEQKITIYQGVLTVVDRTFDKKTAAGSGTLITLSPIDDKNSSELLLLSFPGSAQVVLDSNIVGQTPLLLKKITASDHEIKILKDGYNEKIIKVKTINGKRLEGTIYLGIKPDLSKPIAASPTPVFAAKVLILDTPTGYLNVRSDASASSSVVETVNPGDELDLITSKEDWFEVKLPDGKTGWVSSTYAKKE